MFHRCAITVGVLIALASALTSGAAADSYNVMKENFNRPPKEYRPWTVWWWFGNAVTPDEVTREIWFQHETFVLAHSTVGWPQDVETDVFARLR